MVTVWKIAPGEQAEDWPVFREKGCIGLGWTELQDYGEFESEKDVLTALRKTYGRGAEGCGAGAARSIWRFVDEVNPFHIVIANDGRGRVVGIGKVTSNYLPPKSPKNPIRNDARVWRRHAHLVKWVIDQDIDLRPLFFGIDTVTSLTAEKVSQIRQAYLKRHRGLKDKLHQLFDGVAEGDGARHSARKKLLVAAERELAEDLITIATRKDIERTTKEALVNARVGQGPFREQVLQLWRQCCAVTRSVTLNAIRASHIKPWSKSTDEERLDCQNGLPLIASLDALFDAGLISFASSGKLIVSSKLTRREQRIFGIGKKSLRTKPSTKTAAYLAYHRANRFKK